MTREEIFAMIQAHPVFHLGTVEGDQPRVRAMLIYRADHGGIVFHTGKMRDVHRQLQAHPKTELCFEDTERMIQVRVSGEAELVEDLALKQEIAAHPTRAFLKPFIAAHGYDPLAVYRIRNPVATIWTMAENLAPKRSLAL
ncbi:MAG TPA: pyridoxamine 5'-phosphate oxidase family protein [bacterium]